MQHAIDYYTQQFGREPESGLLKKMQAAAASGLNERYILVAIACGKSADETGKLLEGESVDDRILSVMRRLWRITRTAEV